MAPVQRHWSDRTEPQSSGRRCSDRRLLSGEDDREESGEMDVTEGVADMVWRRAVAG
jgi:hypothetical protein